MIASFNSSSQRRFQWGAHAPRVQWLAPSPTTCSFDWLRFRLLCTIRVPREKQFPSCRCGKSTTYVEIGAATLISGGHCFVNALTFPPPFSRGEKNLSGPRRSQADLYGPKRFDPSQRWGHSRCDDRLPCSHPSTPNHQPRKLSGSTFFPRSHYAAIPGNTRSRMRDG
jgi:hypothetical protein